jgi:hypothetical protein
MSAIFEKETTASTAKSLVGALVALGSGFVFLFLGLVAVTADNVRAEGDREISPLVQALDADLTAYHGGFSLSADGRTLSFTRYVGPEEKKVTYNIIEKTGEVSRVMGEDKRKLARLANPRFELQKTLLRLRYGQNGRVSLAVRRFLGGKERL